MGLVSSGQIQSIANKYLKDSSVTKSVTYKSIAQTYDPADPEVSETITTVTTKGLQIVYTIWEVANSAGAIQENDIRMAINASDLSSITPKQGDRITFESIDWEVLDFEPIEISSTDIMFIFHLRR